MTNIDEVTEIRNFKKETGFSASDIAHTLHVDSYVIRALLRGKTDYLKRDSTGNILPAGTGRYLLDLDMQINHAGITGSNRPVRRDGRMLIAGYKKTDNGCIPDRKELPYYIRCEK